VQEAAEGLTLAEAAARLGVSTDTVRRRIKRGDVSARQEQTKFGPAWVVLLGTAPVPSNGAHGSASPPGSSAPSVAPAPTAGMSELVNLVDKLQHEKAELAAQNGFLQARLQLLQDQLERAQLALEAPKPEPVTVEPTPELEAAPEGEAKPWWKFWR